MNTFVFPSIETSFNQMRDVFISIGSQWLDRVVEKIDASKIHLQDPRLASAFIFVTNFGIIELAYRVAQVVGLCFSENSSIERNIKYIAQGVVLLSVISMGNLALLQITDIALNRLMVTAIVAVASMVKFNLESYLEDE